MVELTKESSREWNSIGCQMPLLTILSALYQLSAVGKSTVGQPVVFCHLKRSMTVDLQTFYFARAGEGFIP